MGYWIRIVTEHQAVNEMLQIQNELLNRLKMAKGVNIVHLGNLLSFWRDFLEQEHMSWEEEIAFAFFRKINHPLVDGLQRDHDQLRNNLAGLEETIKLLRQGKPHSGREYVRLGEEFAETIAGHLSRENAVFKELAAMGGESSSLLEYPLPTGFRRQKLIGVFSVAEELCQEYLEKQFTHPDWPEERTPELTEAEASDGLADPGTSETTTGPEVPAGADSQPVREEMTGFQETDGADSPVSDAPSEQGAGIET